MSAHHQYTLVAELLMDIERELRVLNLWKSENPPLEALSSSLPFAVDTLTYPEWLQFIFIPRLYLMIDQSLALPNISGVEPMAEHYFQSLPSLQSLPLIHVLGKIDSVLSGQ